MAQPSFPKWYIQFFPAPLALALREEDLRAMVLLWGMICEAIRKGEDPVFRMQDVVRQIAALTGTSERTAYRWVARLLEANLDGKRFLRVVSAQEWVPTTGSGRGGDSAPEGVPAAGRLPARGLAVRPGEALEPWIRMLIRRADELDEPHILQTEILQMENPDDKRGTLGGGGENIHGGSHPEKPPPPPFQNSLTFSDLTKMKRSPTIAGWRTFAIWRTFASLENPALLAMARKSGWPRGWAWRPSRPPAWARGRCCATGSGSGRAAAAWAPWWPAWPTAGRPCGT
jgi:hypothetical protein